MFRPFFLSVPDPFQQEMGIFLLFQTSRRAEHVPVCSSGYVLLSSHIFPADFSGFFWMFLIKCLFQSCRENCHRRSRSVFSRIRFCIPAVGASTRSHWFVNHLINSGTTTLLPSFKSCRFKILPFPSGFKNPI